MKYVRVETSRRNRVMRRRMSLTSQEAQPTHPPAPELAGEGSMAVLSHTHPTRDIARDRELLVISTGEFAHWLGHQP